LKGGVFSFYGQELEGFGTFQVEKGFGVRRTMNDNVTGSGVRSDDYKLFHEA
jgi:hypothetical protein